MCLIRNTSINWDVVVLPSQKQELGDSLHGFLQYGLRLVAKYRDIFPPTQSATPKLHTLLRYTWSCSSQPHRPEFGPSQSSTVALRSVQMSISECSKLPRSDQWFVLYLFLESWSRSVRLKRFRNWIQLSLTWMTLSKRPSRSVTVAMGEIVASHNFNDMIFLKPDWNTGVVFHPKGFTSANDKGTHRHLVLLTAPLCSSVTPSFAFAGPLGDCRCPLQVD